jgi:hypothetical protein
VKRSLEKDRRARVSDIGVARFVMAETFVAIWVVHDRHVGLKGQFDDEDTATSDPVCDLSSQPVITSRGVAAGGHGFGAVGPYEKLEGRIEFALDPADRHNRGITDLTFAPKGADGRVHFSSDLYVLRPVDPAKGNSVLLFEVANRGNHGQFDMFNGDGGTDPNRADFFGDALLLRDGYTIVWVGWEFDLPPGRLGLDPPVAVIPPGTRVDPLSVDIIVNARVNETPLIDEPVRPPAVYPPVDSMSADDTLTVRDLFWNAPTAIPRARWRWVVGAGAPPRIELDGGFDPGRWYRVTYRAGNPVVGGVGFAAIRDAASAFRHRTDLPVRGRTTMAYGNSQTGRFLRQFLYEGFNADENDRRVFDAVWSHIAGAARGGYNTRFSTPAHGDMFRPTEFPFTDADQIDVTGARGGLQSRYRPDQRPKVFCTNTPVEYWAGGRAAALIHTSIDGSRDVAPPDNVRVYYLSGTQHLVGPFPPVRTPPADAGVQTRARARFDGQEVSNPTPQRNVMRALLRALHDWVQDGTLPPPSEYPRLSDHTLVPIAQVTFPALPGVADPRRIPGPARIIDGKVTPLPHLVPQVDGDGNDLAGIHDPEAAVPLATTTGWNFRREGVGNPADIYQTLGAYIPFAPTRAARDARGDPRLSIEERYRDRDDYVARVRAAATKLIQRRLMLQEDLEPVVRCAGAHWDFATRERP